MKELQNYEIKERNVIVRVDLNVPVFQDKIIDYSRINVILPTLEKLKKNKNKVFLIAHYGRPKGEYNKKYSIEFLLNELRLVLNLDNVHFLESYKEDHIKIKIKEMNFGDVCLLENIRFNSGEEKNDLNFSKTLASCFDIYINDAFSASHRNHSSITGITEHLPSYAGLSFSKEINKLDKFL